MSEHLSVLAYHVVFGMHGFWLPNDPRGSWSTYVGSRELRRFGPATKTATRRSIAHVDHDYELRLRAKQSLRFPPVSLNGLQARAVGRGFAQAAAESDYVVHACAVLPEHVHLVVARHSRHIRRMVGHFKARATQQLLAEQLWSEADGPVWAKNSWHVFLFTPADLQRAIRYVEENPLRDGKPHQRWPFVVPFEGGVV
jgi:REP element-mobilizing transposase RayT